MGERDAVAPAGLSVHSAEHLDADGPQAAPADDPSAGGPSPAGPPAPPVRSRRRGSRGRVIVAGVVAVAATAAALMALGTAGRGSSAPPPPPVAKNFQLPVLGHPGQHISLSAYAGKPVILNFFASWCAPCQHETPLIARFYRDTHGRVAIIGIDVSDQTPAATKFVHADGVSYPVAVDAGAAPTASAYGLLGLPQTFFLDAQHRIVKRVGGAVTLRDLQTGMAMIAPKSK